jgi:plasmid stability protein
MNTFIIRNIPENVERHLRDVSKKTGKSLNDTIIGFLSNALEIAEKSSEQKKFRNVSSVIRLQDEKDISELEDNLKVFEKIDNEMWRQ